MSDPRISSYGLNDSTGPFSPDQTNSGATTAAFTIVGSGATYSSGRLNIPAGTYLDGGAAGITLPTDSDPDLTQTPASMTLTWIGIMPAIEAPLVSLYQWEQARFALYSHWDSGRLRLNIERNGNTAMIDSIGGISTSTENAVGVRWDDDPDGPGGTVTFLYNGTPHGPAQPVGFKLRITPDCVLECNASLGNISNTASQQIKEIEISVTETHDPEPPEPGDYIVYGNPERDIYTCVTH